MEKHKHNWEFSKKQKKQASLWVAKHERGLTQSEELEFQQWLKEDSSNEDCYFEQNVIWGTFDPLEDWKPKYSSEPNADLFEKPKKLKQALTYPIVGLAAILAIGFVYFSQITVSVKEQPRAELVEYFAENNERHFLEDGSSFYLKQGSRLKVEYTQNQRDIEIFHGQAYFNVVSDAERPFIVKAPSGRVTAVGTAFSVKQDELTWEVYVTEGIVDVDESISADETNHVESTPERSPIRLIAGQKVTQNSPNDDIEIIKFTKSELDDQFSWKNKIIEMVSAPIEEIVAEFMRFEGQKPIIVEDEAIKQLTMTILIRLDNLDDFLELLEITMGIQHREDSQGIYLYI